MSGNPVDQVSRRKRRLPGQHVVPAGSERVDVAPRVRRSAVASLLGRHVVHRANRRSGTSDPGGVAVVHRPGQSHIGQLDRTVAHDHEIGRLDVAVDDVLLESVLQCQRHLSDYVEGTFWREHSFPHQKILDINAVDKFHGDVEIAIRLSGVVDTDNIFVFQVGCGASLGFETPNEHLILGFVTRQNLQRDDSAKRVVDRSIDGPHTAFPDLLLQAIATERFCRPLARLFLVSGSGSLLGSHTCSWRTITELQSQTS